MKRILKENKYLKLCFIIMLFMFLSGCNGVTPLPVPPPTPTSPTINSFSADFEVIGLGGNATLSWEVSDATTVAIEPGVGTVDSFGSISVSPTDKTTYTLMASNDSGIVTADVTISILYPPWEYDITIPIFPPVIQSFSADSLIVTEGGSVTLSWEVSGLANVTIEPGIGTVDPIGSISVSPTKTTKYNLTAGNISGDDSAQLTVILLQTKILQPAPNLGKDSYISNNISNNAYPNDTNFADYNFGDYGTFIVGRDSLSGVSRKSFLQVNAIENLPVNTVILSAHLELYLHDTYSSYEFYIELHIVTESWEENTITWNNQPDYLQALETKSPIHPSVVPCWVSWDIASLLQGWVNGSIANYGIALIAGDVIENNARFFSCEYEINPSKRPRLDITYYIP